MDLVLLKEEKNSVFFRRLYQLSVFLPPYTQKVGVWTILYQGRKSIYESMEPVHRMWDRKSSSLPVLTRNSSAPFNLRVKQSYVLDITSILCLMNTVITKAI